MVFGNRDGKVRKTYRLGWGDVSGMRRRYQHIQDEVRWLIVAQRQLLGWSEAVVAQANDVGLASVSRIMHNFRTRGNVWGERHYNHGCRKRVAQDEDLAIIMHLLESNCIMYLAEVRSSLAALCLLA